MNASNMPSGSPNSSFFKPPAVRSWIGAPKHWPRRLLHIESLRSVEKDEDNTYNTGIPGTAPAKEPKYNILTYTWGRWRIKNPDKDTPALPISNTPWKIPAVEATHFTTNQFEQAIKALGCSGIEWAWIDVACIDQDGQNGVDEIGRQAGIFNNAHGTFVWLSTLPASVLTDTIISIKKEGVELHDLAFEVSPLTKSLLASLREHFSVLFADPWFSSLWTLQEMILRNDAMVLSKEASPIAWDSGQCMYMTMLVNHCRNIFHDLEYIETQVASSLESKINKRHSSWGWPTSSLITDDGMMQQVEDIKMMILRAGFYFLFTENPNVQYGIAQYRKTSRPVDRVYAIMQIYNLRVGIARDPTRRPELPELMDEFALAIIQDCPILGQMFIHTETPERGKSWRITQASSVPECLFVYTKPVPSCELIIRSGTVFLKGYYCDFYDFFSGKDPIATRKSFNMVLDKHICDHLEAYITGPGKLMHNLKGPYLIREYYGSALLNVLLLGTMNSGTRVGLLTIQRQSRVDRVARRERIGVCTWASGRGLYEEELKEAGWNLEAQELA